MVVATRSKIAFALDIRRERRRKIIEELHRNGGTATIPQLLAKLGFGATQKLSPYLAELQEAGRVVWVKGKPAGKNTTVGRVTLVKQEPS